MKIFSKQNALAKIPLAALGNELSMEEFHSEIESFLTRMNSLTFLLAI